MTKGSATKVAPIGRDDGSGAESVATARLGAQIRAARKAAGISVRELARRIDVSASFISQVELGRARPVIGTLYSIVSELGLSLDGLLDESRAPTKGATARKAGGPAAPGGNVPGYQPAEGRASIRVGQVLWERLTPTDDSKADFLRITYPPHSESCSPDNLQRHEGWEYGFILEGQLDIQVMFESQTLGVGDSINFDSGLPHRFSNPYPTECVAIWFVVGRRKD